MEDKVIEIPVAKLGMSKTLKLEPGLKEIAEAYLYRQMQGHDYRNRFFYN